MAAESNLTIDRSKLGTKRHILTDKEGIPLSVVISSASTNDVKLVLDVGRIMRLLKDIIHYLEQKIEVQENNIYVLINHVSKLEEQEIVKRGYVLHLPYKRKRGEIMEEIEKISNRKKHPARRWVVERTNSWHNRFRKLFTRYEKKVENYLGLVQFSCCMIIYRKIILG